MEGSLKVEECVSAVSVFFFGGGEKIKKKKDYFVKNVERVCGLL